MFGLCRASVCDSGLKGRFPVAQGAALGLGHPQNSFLGLKGRFQSECGCLVKHGVPGAYAPGFAEIGPSGLWGAVAACAWFVPCVCLRLRPEGLFSGISGAQPWKCPLLLR